MSELLANIGDKLKAKFGEGITAAGMEREFPVFTVKREQAHEILQFLRDDNDTGFKFLTTLCGLHYPDNKGKELGVMYQLHNLQKNWRIRLKTFFPVNDPTITTISDLYPTANWMERQEYDFYGIIFKGHPNLKRILNMDEMDYHPMRKEYPLEDGTREDKDNTMFGR